MSAGGGNPDEGEMIDVLEMGIKDAELLLAQKRVTSPGGFLFGILWFLHNKAPLFKWSRMRMFCYFYNSTNFLMYTVSFVSWKSYVKCNRNLLIYKLQNDLFSTVFLYFYENCDMVSHIIMTLKYKLSIAPLQDGVNEPIKDYRVW